MKNYDKKLSYNTSKEYYLNVLKRDNKNLNLSKDKLGKLDIFDLYLEKVLNFSYKIFSPIFKDDETILITKNDYQHNDIDVEFDKQIEKSLPNWINQLLDLFKIIYHKIFPKKLVDFCVKVITKSFLVLVLIIKPLFKALQNRIFIINSSP